MAADPPETSGTAIAPAGPFALAEAGRFLGEFTPADHPGAEDGHLHLAFLTGPDFQPVAVCVRQPTEDVVVEQVAGSPADSVVEDLARMLSLDVDATAWPRVGDRDPVIGGLQARRPGFRPVGFATPYDAAVWAVLSQRTRMAQAATVRTRIAQRHGTTFDAHGEQLAVLPAPAELAAVVADLDVPEVRRRRLDAVADAALAGRLDAQRLRAMPVAEALADLQEIPGIGPFSAELVLVRGAMLVDALPRHERRLLQAVGALYGRSDPGPDDLARIAEDWRPFRTWACVLVRALA